MLKDLYACEKDIWDNDLELQERVIEATQRALSPLYMLQLDHLTMCVTSPVLASVAEPATAQQKGT